jgi:hypothetical protein
MRHKVFIIGAFLVYIIGVTIVMVVKGVGITPDRFLPLFILPSLFIHKTRKFLLDFLPLLFILLSYEYLRGLAGLEDEGIHFFGQINADLFLFRGNLPPIFLQQLLYNPNHLQWYDFLFTIVYFIHFVIPLVFAYILWILNREKFKEFITGLSILSYAGWITYLLYPSAPPWLASNLGYIPHITKIMDFTVKAFPESIHLPTAYQNFNPNQVAAIPSLHAAYPFLIFLFGYRFFGKKMLPMLLYTGIVWLAIIYLGEHYFSDCLIGALYALGAYIITVKVLHNPIFYIRFNNIRFVKFIYRKLPSFIQN